MRIRYVRTLLALGAFAGSLLGHPLSAQGAAPWYRRSRTIDLTGASLSDSIVLLATGKKIDSLAISMTFYVGGKVVHVQRWTSEDELYDTDSLRKSPAKLQSYLRGRLDEVIKGVKRERINREQVQHMGDVALLKRIVPPPTHQVVLSYAFETSAFFAWDATKKKLVVFMECC